MIHFIILEHGEVSSSSGAHPQMAKRKGKSYSGIFKNNEGSLQTTVNQKSKCRAAKINLPKKREIQKNINTIETLIGTIIL
jgi:hypothetical protein